LAFVPKGVKLMKRPPVPSLHYDEAPAAIDFLCRALGFEQHFVARDEKRPTTIYQAELKFGGGMVMLGSVLPSSHVNELYGWKTRREANCVTSCISLIVDDLDAHYARALAAGAEIIREPHENQGFPGRTYDVRDTEGYVWNVTTYDPWANNH
jgi:uncharacterized glyoxalase superfamily protein PhnB